MKDINNAVVKCQNILKENSITPGEIVTVRVNKRIKRSWGRCIRKDGVFSIELSPKILDDYVPDKSLEEVLLHELLHTCKGCFNHGTTWKRKAEILNNRYGYNIKRTSSYEEYGVDRNVAENHPKYSIICCKCNSVGYRWRACGVVTHPENYKCKCGGSLKIVINPA